MGFICSIRRFTVFQFLCMALIASALPSPAHAKLVLDKDELGHKASVGESQWSEEVKFINKGDRPLKVTKVMVTCGCLEATTDKTEYAPGEAGTLSFRMKYGALTGTQRKTLAVVTDDPVEREALLVLTVDIPKLVEVTPRVLKFYQRKDDPREQVSKITFLSGPVKVTGITRVTGTANAKLRTIKEGREYEVVVTLAESSAKDNTKPAAPVAAEKDAKPDAADVPGATGEAGEADRWQPEMNVFGVDTDSANARLKTVMVQAMVYPVGLIAEEDVTRPNLDEPTAEENAKSALVPHERELTWTIGDKPEAKSIILRPAKPGTVLLIQDVFYDSNIFSITYLQHPDGSWQLNLKPKNTKATHSAVFAVVTQQKIEGYSSTTKVVGRIVAKK